MNNPVSSIIFDKVTFGYKKDKRILSDISFSISNADSENNGHVTVLMGESGAGKSTILKLLLGIESRYTGNISLYPVNPTISYIPQEAVLFEHLSPLQNARYFENIPKYRQKFNEDNFKELVDALDMKTVLTARSVLEISGGQKQKLSLLRALSIMPDFLILDEPCTGLDAEVKFQFLIRLRQLIKHYKLCVIYVTHHQDEARIIADDILFLSKNRLTQGDVVSFFRHPPILEAARIFHFPELNVIPAASISEYDDVNNLLVFKTSDVSFNNDDGFEFNVVSGSGMLSQISIENLNIILTVDTRMIVGNKYCTINGNCSEYASNGRFLNEVKVINNKIQLCQTI